MIEYCMTCGKPVVPGTCGAYIRKCEVCYLLQKIDEMNHRIDAESNNKIEPIKTRLYFLEENMVKIMETLSFREESYWAKLMRVLWTK